MERVSQTPSPRHVPRAVADTGGYRCRSNTKFIEWRHRTKKTRESVNPFQRYKLLKSVTGSGWVGSGRVGLGRAAHTEISPLNHRRTRSALRAPLVITTNTIVPCMQRQYCWYNSTIPDYFVPCLPDTALTVSAGCQRSAELPSLRCCIPVNSAPGLQTPFTTEFASPQAHTRSPQPCLIWSERLPHDGNNLSQRQHDSWIKHNPGQNTRNSIFVFMYIHISDPITWKKYWPIRMEFITHALNLMFDTCFEFQTNDTVVQWDVIYFK